MPHPLDNLRDLDSPFGGFKRIFDEWAKPIGLKAFGEALRVDEDQPLPPFDANGPRAITRAEADEIEARRAAPEASAVVVISEPPGLFDAGMLAPSQAKAVFQVVAGRGRGKQSTMRAWAWQLCIIAYAIDEAAASPWLTDEQLAAICAPLCQDCEAADGYVISAPDPRRSDTVARFIGTMRKHNGGPIPDRVPVNCGPAG